jgi:hypothetical protein
MISDFPCEHDILPSVQRAALQGVPPSIIWNAKQRTLDQWSKISNSVPWRWRAPQDTVAKAVHLGHLSGERTFVGHPATRHLPSEASTGGSR